MPSALLCSPATRICVRSCARGSTLWAGHVSSTVGDGAVSAVTAVTSVWAVFTMRILSIRPTRTIRVSGTPRARRLAGDPLHRGAAAGDEVEDEHADSG